MEYEGRMFRPPSEAHSLLVQVTIGCSHNKCTFCGNYKEKRFRIRPMDDIRRDLEECGRRYGNRVQRIFLCDGNALVMKMRDLREIFQLIRGYFPHCERVGVYATAQDILRKTPEELRELHELGLGILYLGLESGSDEVLRRVNKGITAQEMIDAVVRAREAGITTSVMVITGLGGPELWKEHAEETARVLNAMQPDYVGLLALMIEPETPLAEQVARGEFRLLTPKEVVSEMYVMVRGMELEHCFFSSVHASNYITLRGNLPEDKERLLREMEYYMEHEGLYRPEEYRGL